VNQPSPNLTILSIFEQKECTMIIERNKKEVIIRLPASVDTEDLQDFVDYARYKELTSKSTATQKDIDKLAAQVNKDWWTENRKRFVK
jgi:hypothetical protein